MIPIRMYPDLPPPTYNESVFGVANVRHSEDDEHTGGDFENSLNCWKEDFVF